MGCYVTFLVHGSYATGCLGYVMLLVLMLLVVWVVMLRFWFMVLMLLVGCLGYVMLLVLVLLVVWVAMLRFWFMVLMLLVVWVTLGYCSWF